LCSPGHRSAVETRLLQNEAKSNFKRSASPTPPLQVPFRRVHLTTGSHFDLYDTSGPGVCVVVSGGGVPLVLLARSSCAEGLIVVRFCRVLPWPWVCRLFLCVLSRVLVKENRSARPIRPVPLRMRSRARRKSQMRGKHSPQTSDPRLGLPKLRAPWVAAREAAGDAAPTQASGPHPLLGGAGRGHPSRRTGLIALLFQTSP
jgi:hypothetical protein